MFAISKTTKILAAIFGTCATATVISGIHDHKSTLPGEILDEPDETEEGDTTEK